MTKSHHKASRRELAKSKGLATYNSRRCGDDGTYVKNTDTGKCAECERYAKAISAGRINGIRGQDIPVKTREDKWGDEARLIHAEAVRKGIERCKKLSNGKPRKTPEAVARKCVNCGEGFFTTKHMRKSCSRKCYMKYWRERKARSRVASALQYTKEIY